MNYYAASLNGLKQILHASGEIPYEKYIDDCIREWEERHSAEKLEAAFKKGGIFENFVFQRSDFNTDEEQFWYTQIFGGMVAMSIRLAQFERANRPVSIGFMRKNCGIPSDVISGNKCQNCGAKEINQSDIDRYITPTVIAKTIVDGLDKDNLPEKINEILTLRSKTLTAARAEAMARALNSNVSVSDERTPMTICKRCGSKDIAKCRFLRHTKEPSFVALSH